MYRNCMYCQKDLGSNAVIEEFPVGRRLAFDAEKGRLWVVCRRCERWNLTPLEERWEAVETCEKLSSENMGLAKHPEGLELVRIGKPLRPEFAAWRYGDQFGSRRRRAIVLGAVATVAGVGGLVLGGALVGLGGVGLVGPVYHSIEVWSKFRPSVFFRPQDGRLRWMNGHRIRSARLVPADDESGFSVEATASGVVSAEERFEGEDGVRALNAIMPRVNAGDGSRGTCTGRCREDCLCGAARPVHEAPCTRAGVSILTGRRTVEHADEAHSPGARNGTPRGTGA
ncbi:MAG: hypothetical protein F4106_03470 [Gemmatimonadetes bacterium]|nr:hypothetical protein [Gemmatimonadota bacterium]MYJ17097.1 hypothetical protein [Gemmatimonadota bacterium]